jgi:hypothetical protein
MLGLSFEEIRAKVKDAIKKQMEVGRALVLGFGVRVSDAIKT